MDRTPSSWRSRSRDGIGWETAFTISAIKTLQHSLVAGGILRQEEERAIFTQDYAFNSPSAAAAVMNGRPASRHVECTDERSGLTLHEWEAKKLKDLPS